MSVTAPDPPPPAALAPQAPVARIAEPRQPIVQAACANADRAARPQAANPPSPTTNLA